MSNLSALHRRQLWETILAAFDRNELSELLSIELNTRLDHIAASHNFSETALNIVEWAERHGRIYELVTAVQRARPQNLDLQAVAMVCLASLSEQSIATPVRPQIFISYRRNSTPDEPLAMRLGTALERAGYRIFVDRKILIGLDWAREIQHQIEESDFMLVLLSEASIQSEMVVEEVIHAAKQTESTGKARLIPIRLAFNGPLPYQLGPILDKLQYAAWYSESDDVRLLEQIREAISMSPTPQRSDTLPALYRTDTVTARPYADPRFLETLHEPGGAVHANSSFYIERDEDEQLRRELAKPHGTTTTIRAARQTGKSSLLINAAAQIKKKGSKLVYIDLQPIDDKDLQSLDMFLRYFATVLVTKLRLDSAEVEKAWRGGLGPSDKATYLLEEYVLPTVQTNVVLALDEVDRLLRTPYHDTFFGLLRFWHNSRALDELWNRMNIVMVISTEPHLLISDVTQSPFNVGQKIRLKDFTAGQVAELNRRYRSPCDDDQAAELADYLNGHPYLTHKAIHTLLTEQMSWPVLRRLATNDHSPFSDHLRRYLWLLREQPELRDALRRVLEHGECPDEVSFYRLLQAGLIQGVERTICTARCKLYEDFFSGKL